MQSPESADDVELHAILCAQRIREVAMERDLPSDELYDDELGDGDVTVSLARAALERWGSAIATEFMGLVEHHLRVQSAMPSAPVAASLRVLAELKSARNGEDEDWNALGMRWSNEGDLLSAEGAFLIAAEEDPDDPAPLNNLAGCFQQRADFRQAEETYLRAARLDESRFEPHRNLVSLAFERGDFRSAERHARVAVELAPERPELHLALADALTRQGKLQASETVLRAALEQHPEARVWSTLGEVLVKLGQHAEGVAAHRTAFEREPTLAFQISLVEALFASGDREAGHQESERAARAFPESALPYYTSGRHFRHAGRVAEAREALLKALEHEPDMPEALLELGVVHFEQGELDHAERAWRFLIDEEHAERRRELFVSAHVNLALVAIRRDKFDIARDLLDRAVAAEPDSCLAHYNYASLMMRDGDFAASMQHVQLALRKDPELVPALLLAAALFYRRRDEALATEMLQRVLAVDPENRDAKSGIEQLHRDEREPWYFRWLPSLLRGK